MTAPVSTAAKVVRSLKRRGFTLSVAESITGGLLAGAITDIPGSSAVFLGGIISYSDFAKTEFLEVPKRILTKETAVSEKVAIAMATSVRQQFGSDFAIATTGVAGPGKAYGFKAGTVWVAISSSQGDYAFALALSGTRAQIRHATIESALAAFARILSP